MDRHSWLRLGLATGCGLVVAAASSLVWRAELITADVRQRLAPARLASASRIVLVAIDDESCRLAADDLRRLPWPRSAYARLIQVIALAHPRAVALDLLLPEPGPGDDELADVLREVPVLLACDAGPDGGAGGYRLRGTPPERAPRLGVTLPPWRDLPAQYASIHVTPEPDGVTRRIGLVADNHGALLASLSLALAERCGRAVEVRRDGVFVERTRLAGDDGYLWPRFPAEPGAFPYRSAWELLRAWQLLSESEPVETAVPFVAELRDAAVIVTVTATAGFDLRTVPTAGAYPGGKILATALASILDGRRVLRPRGWFTASATVLVALLLGLLALRARRPATLAAAAVGCGIVWGGVAGVAWSVDFWLPVAGPLVALVVTLPALLVEGWWVEGRERRRVQAIFGRYVAPDILKVLLERPGAAHLGGERRRITILFSDIRSYTTMSEGLSPEAVVSWLNEYFTAQVAVIKEHRGTVDKFIGDAVMAFWGAPLAQLEQERMAATCAAAMLRTAGAMAEDWRSRSGPPLAIGIGLATGDAVVGDVGAEQLRNYTAIGDTVNLASRLEGKTKELGVGVVLDEATALGSGLPVVHLAEILVKGRSQAVRVYTLQELTRGWHAAVEPEGAS